MKIKLPNGTVKEFHTEKELIEITLSELAPITLMRVDKKDYAELYNILNKHFIQANLDALPGDPVLDLSAHISHSYAIDCKGNWESCESVNGFLGWLNKEKSAWLVLSPDNSSPYLEEPPIPITSIRREDLANMLKVVEQIKQKDSESQGTIAYVVSYNALYLNELFKPYTSTYEEYHAQHIDSLMYGYAPDEELEFPIPKTQFVLDLVLQEDIYDLDPCAVWKWILTVSDMLHESNFHIEKYYVKNNSMQLVLVRTA